jgi:hypothetical protein
MMEDYFNQFKRIKMGDNEKKLPSETVLLHLAEVAKFELYQKMALHKSFSDAQKLGKTHTSSLNWGDEKYHVVNKMYSNYGINLNNVTNLLKKGKFPILAKFLTNI